MEAAITQDLPVAPGWPLQGRPQAVQCLVLLLFLAAASASAIDGKSK